MTNPNPPFATPPYNAMVHDQTPPVKRELLRIQGAIQPQVTTPVFFSGGANNSPYTVKTTDGLIPCDCTAGAISIVLPAANRAKEGRWTIKKVDSSANAVTITTPSGTIDGASSYALTIQYETVTVRSDGTNYQVEQFPISAGLAHTLTFGPHLQAAGTSYNGSANVTIATDATSANTVSTIVARDSSGNFSAGAVSVTSLTASATVSGADHTISANAHHIKGTTTIPTTVNIMGVPSSNATRIIAAVDASGVDWTNQAETAQWMLLTSGRLTIWTAGSASAGGGIQIGTDAGSNPSIFNNDPYNNQFGQGSLNLYPVAVAGGHGAGAKLMLSAWSGATNTTALSVANVNSGALTITASALILANGGLTVASGQALTLTGVTVVGLSFTPITGNLTYAQLPTGNGTWDTGAGTLITIARSITVSGTTSTVGFTVSNTASFLNASPFSMSGGGGNVVTVAITLPTAGATVTIPDFAGVNDTFAFVTLAQTLANKTLASSCVVPIATLTGTLLLANGGTGLTSYMAGDLPYFASGTAFTKLGIGSANTVLTSSGSAPQWSTNIAYAALPTGNGTWDTGAGTTLTVAQNMTVNGNFQVSTGALATIITASTGLVAIGGSFHLNGTYTTAGIIQMSPTVTNASGFGRIFFAAPTMVAAANNDIFFGVSMAPAFTPGSFTGLGVISFSISSFSVASFVSPADPIMLSFGQITGTGAANAYTIKLGAGPTGATNNYLIHATNFQLTSAGAATFASNLSLTTGITKYQNVATAGFGVPAIYASGRVTAKTNATSGTVCTYTPAADGTFTIYANVNVTTSTTFSFTVTCTYTDEGGTSRTQTFSFAQVGGVPIQTLTNVTGAGTYDGFPLTIRAKGANAITILTAPAGTYTAVVYNISGAIAQLAA